MSVLPSVIVTTYNKPRELGLVLCGLSRQAYPPTEILVADDGSTPETARVVEAWSKTSKVPIRHVWHEDAGNRKSQICDKAASEAKGNYLIFLDGDSIPHSLWVKDHITEVRKGVVLCGRRVRLGPRVTHDVDVPFIQAGKLENITGPLLMSALRMDTKRYMLGIRLPAGLVRCCHPRERRLMGVNFSLHKESFERVGGYSNQGTRDKPIPTEERRREDAQLEIRLITAGLSRFPLLNRAVVYHLYHRQRLPNKEVDDLIQGRYAHALRQRDSGNG